MTVAPILTHVLSDPGIREPKTTPQVSVPERETTRPSRRDVAGHDPDLRLPQPGARSWGLSRCAPSHERVDPRLSRTGISW